MSVYADKKLEFSFLTSNMMLIYTDKTVYTA